MESNSLSQLHLQWWGLHIRTLSTSLVVQWEQACPLHDGDHADPNTSFASEMSGFLTLYCARVKLSSVLIKTC